MFVCFNKFIYLWLCWVFVSVLGLSPVVASGGHSSSRCMGPSLSQPLSLWSTGSRCTGSVVVAHRLSCSTACGIFPDQGSNPCPLHWPANYQPLRHQGSPKTGFIQLFCNNGKETSVRTRLQSEYSMGDWEFQPRNLLVVSGWKIAKKKLQE